MSLKKKLLLVSLLPLFAFSTHKYYLSLTQIEFNEVSKSVEIIVNVFVDDIETVLNTVHEKKFELDTTFELENSDAYFYQYLQKHLNFKINNKSVQYSFIGKEYDGNIVFFYLEIKNIQHISTIEVTNTVLIASFSKQQNLIKSKVNKKNSSVLLTKKKQKETFTYELP
jgi:hypothetical protein